MRARNKKKLDQPLRIAGYVRVSSQRQVTEGARTRGPVGVSVSCRGVHRATILPRFSRHSA